MTRQPATTTWRSFARSASNAWRVPWVAKPSHSTMRRWSGQVASISPSWVRRLMSVEGIERSRAREAADLRFLEGRFEVLLGEDCGKVEQRARGCGHRDAVDDRDLVGLQHGLVELHSPGGFRDGGPRSPPLSESCRACAT